MILTNPFDHADAVRARESQDDPLVQYLVVRRERTRSLPELMTAAATATVAAARIYATEDPWRADFAAWKVGSFRKVTLRANERDWVKLLAAEPLISMPATDPIVAVLPPRRRSSVSKFIRGLQAYVVDPSDLAAEAAPVLDEPAMIIAVNPSVHMSAGKLLAQVAHAALMSADAPVSMKADAAWAEAVSRWQEVAMPIHVCAPSPAAWDTAMTGAAIDAVVVTDSGLTELAPGTRTVLASRPAQYTELRAWLAALSR